MEDLSQSSELSPKGLISALKDYLYEEDIEYLVSSSESEDSISFEDTLGYAYGALLEYGYDPDIILAELGIIETLE